MIQYKKIWSFLSGLVIMFTTVTGVANAQCCRWDCCAQCPQLQPIQPCCDDCGFFFGADFLFWTTYETNLDYAVDGAPDLESPEEIISIGGLGPGKMHFMDYDWDTGYRIVLGYRFGCDGWDGRAVYTYFHNKAHGRAKGKDLSGQQRSDLQLLEATLLNAQAKVTVDAEEAHADKSLDYDLLDVLFSRPFCLGKTVISRPFFGVRALWLNQTLRAKYEGGGISSEASSQLSSDINPRKVKWGSDWAGAGLHAGMETNVHLGNCFSLYGTFGGTILAGRNNSRNKQTGFQESDSSDENLRLVLDIKEKEWTAMPGFNLATGLTWETQWCDYCFLFNAGYEFFQWIHTPQIRRYSAEKESVSSTGANSGSLLIHGATLNASVYF